MAWRGVGRDRGLQAGKSPVAGGRSRLGRGAVDIGREEEAATTPRAHWSTRAGAGGAPLKAAGVPGPAPPRPMRAAAAGAVCALWPPPHSAPWSH